MRGWPGSAVMGWLCVPLWACFWGLGWSAARAVPPIFIDEDTIDVTINFVGTHVELITYLPQTAPDLKFVLVGPPADLVTRRKARRAGLWINAEKELRREVASYIALIGFGEEELAQICAADRLATYAPEGAPDIGWACEPEQRALMAADKLALFQFRPTDGLIPKGQGFHEVRAFLPPTARPGTYRGRFWADAQSADTQITVRKAGLERWVLTTAENRRFLYGLLCLALAALAGNLTNLIFSRRA